MIASSRCIYIYIYIYIYTFTSAREYHGQLTQINGGTRGVMVTVLGNGHGDTSSNPGRD